MEVSNREGDLKVREGINWLCLEAFIMRLEDKWYYALAGEDTYERLKDLRAWHLKTITICSRSKRWYELTT